ncbi:MAG: preprotein translocase subunit SecE [Mycobacteriales bacterium]
MTELQSGGVQAEATPRAPTPAPAGSGRRGGGGRRGGRAGGGRPGRHNPLTRTRRYMREVVSELRKVIYPSRTELVTYVSVVLVFVSFMVAVVAGLDYVFTKAVLSIFG